MAMGVPRRDWAEHMVGELVEALNATFAGVTSTVALIPDTPSR
jgi:hypothetical protein